MEIFHSKVLEIFLIFRCAESRKWFLKNECWNLHNVSGSFHSCLKIRMSQVQFGPIEHSVISRNSKRHFALDMWKWKRWQGSTLSCLVYVCEQASSFLTLRSCETKESSQSLKFQATWSYDDSRNKKSRRRNDHRRFHSRPQQRWAKNVDEIGIWVIGRSGEPRRRNCVVTLKGKQDFLNGWIFNILFENFKLRTFLLALIFQFIEPLMKEQKSFDVKSSRSDYQIGSNACRFYVEMMLRHFETGNCILWLWSSSMKNIKKLLSELFRIEFTF